MGYYEDDRRPVSRVDGEAYRLKDSLEEGRTRDTVSALHQEMQSMNPREFRAMLNRVGQIDDTRYGDNLRVGQDGDIWLNDRNNRNFKVGNIYQQEQCWEERQAQLQRQQIPDRPVIYESQAGPYYDQYQQRVPQPVYVERQPQFIPQPRYGVVGGGPYYAGGYRQDPLTNMAEGALLGGAFSSITGGRFGRGAAAGGVLGLIMGNRGW